MDKTEAFLAHHGVLGMHWGIRKSDEQIARERKQERSKSSSPRSGKVISGSMSKENIKALVDAGADQHTEARMQDRFGPGTLKNGPGIELNKEFYTKAGLILGLAGAVVASKNPKLMAALSRQVTRVIASHKLGVNTRTLPPAFRQFMNNHVKTSISKTSKGYPKDYLDKLGTERLSFPKGHTFTRISANVEKDIHPDGFFAAHKADDVTRYKAVLPSYWPLWGHNKVDSGFVVSIKANSDISIPSEKHAIQTFKDMLDDVVIEKDWLTGSPVKLRNAFGDKIKAVDDDDFVRQVFPSFAATWNNKVYNPTMDAYFAKLKSQGYHGVIDMNDVGSIGDQPLRLFDGTMFSVAGNEALSSAAIAEARSLISQLSHAIKNGAIFVASLFVKERGSYG